MAIQNIEEFTHSMTFTQFAADKRTQFATVYNIQIIGEAAYMLTKEFKAQHAEVNWLVIEKMRHVIVHGYYTIRMEIIWNVVAEDIPTLKPQIQRLVKSLK